MKTQRKAKSVRGHHVATLAAIGISLLPYLVPPIRWLFLPLQYLETHLHEFCHAIVATLTGGQVDHIMVFANGGGLTYIVGGSQVLVDSAGYLGATAIGAFLLSYGRTANRSRIAFGVLGLILTASMLLWVRGDLVGIGAGLAWMLLLLLGAAFLRGVPAIFLCQLVGIQQCLNAIDSVLYLFKISMVTEAQSDALNMQNVTHIPAVIWAALWCFISFGVVFLTIRMSWNPAPNQNPAE